MPDGRTVLFAIGSGSTSEYELAAVSLDTGEPRRLGVTGVKPFYIAPGYVLFARAGAIWAAPFDVATLEFQAEALPVLEGLVDLGYSFGTARFTVASNASVAFWSGSRYRRPPRYPSIVDRNGVTVIEFPDEISARRVRFSPDDRRIAFTQRDALTARVSETVRVADLERGTVSQIAEGVFADWTPAGEVGYVVGDDTNFALYEIPWDLARPADRVAQFWRYTEELTWLPDSRNFVFASRPEGAPRGPRDLFVSSAERTHEPWLTTERSEQDPQLSPDGSWIAYSAVESNGSVSQVFIQPFPGPGGQLQVSVESGLAPRWTGDGRRIFFWSDGVVYEVAGDRGDVRGSVDPRPGGPMVRMRTGGTGEMRRSLVAMALCALALAADAQESEEFGDFHCEMLAAPDGGPAVPSCRGAARRESTRPRSGRYQSATPGLRISSTGVFLAFQAHLGFEGETLTIRYWPPSREVESIEARVASDTVAWIAPEFVDVLVEFEREGLEEVSFRPMSTARVEIRSTIVGSLVGLGAAVAWIDIRSPVRVPPSR